MRTGVGKLDRAATDGVGSMALFASKTPPPKPMAKITNVVPMPAKKALMFDAMITTPVMPRTRGSRLRSDPGKISNAEGSDSSGFR